MLKVLCSLCRYSWAEGIGKYCLVDLYMSNHMLVCEAVQVSAGSLSTA